MIKSKQAFATLLSLGIIFAIGCSSAGGTLKHTMEPSTTLDTYKSVSIQVESKVEKSEEDMKALEAMVFKYLKDSGEWELITNGQLLLKIMITEMRRVSPAARVLAGAFAGKAKTNAEVMLVDGASGKTLRQLTAEGESSGGSVFAGTTDQSIDELAKQIVKGIGKKQ